MEKKKGSLSTVLLVIAIILIVVMGALLYMQKIEKDRQIAELQGKIDSISNTINNDTAEETGTQLDVNDNLVRKVIEKIDLPTYATASIYNEGKFNLNTISNDLILRLGWSKLNDDDKETFLVEEESMYKDRTTKEKMNKSIVNIFGSKVKYTDKSFTNVDVPVFYDYEQNQGEIKYSNNVYTANSIDGGGATLPFIYQEINKVIKYNNKIEVYVNTAFIDVQGIENNNGDDFEYIIYKNYKNNMFEEKLGTVTEEEFTNNYSNDEYNGKIFFKTNNEIAPIVDKLNTYVYTFELDNATGEYYLSEFNKG